MHKLARMRLSWQEQLLAGMDWLARRRGRKANVPVHLAIGLEGEDAAFFYLRRKGYTVVARRWSSGNLRGDIDLIAWDGPLLCVAEVKTRSTHDLAPAESKVDSHKRHMLRRLARLYVRQLPREAQQPQVRFDVVSVYLLRGEEREFVHFENAFGWDENRDDWE